MCLTADTSCVAASCVGCCWSPFSYVYSHTSWTHQKFLTAVMWHLLSGSIIGILKDSAQVSHSTWDDSSAIYFDIKMFYIDLNNELINYNPFSQKKLHVILLAALSLFRCTFFLLLLLILWRLWLFCVIEFLMARCITIMVFAVWQHVVWYMATNIFYRNKTKWDHTPEE